MTALLAMDWTWVLWPAVFVFHVALVGIFTGLETGIYVTNKVRLELHAEAGYPAACRLAGMLTRPNRLLADLLIGTNICFYVATFAVSAMFLEAGYVHSVEWLTLAVTTPLFFAVGDSIPKNVYRRLGERIVYPLMGVLTWADRLFRVTGLNLLVRLFSEGLLRLAGHKPQAETSLLGHEGLAAVLVEGHAVGMLSQSQAQMAEKVMHIGQVHVRDVYIPLAQAVTVPAGTSRAAFLDLVGRHDYRRYPLLACGQVAGVVDIFDLLSDERDGPIDKWAFEPIVLAASLPLAEAIFTLQRSRRSLAVVADEAGRHVGIVTVKDLVEEIVGDLAEW